MTDVVKWAETEGRYRAMKGALGKRVDLASSLPDWPFLTPSGFLTIFEYDRVTGGGFGSVIHSLADVYGDDWIIVIATDPGPATYRDSYQVFPAFEIASADVASGYGDGMWFEPGGDPTGALELWVDRLAIFGTSNRWTVWADRGWEIGLLLTPDESGPWLDQDVQGFHPSIDLATIRSPAGWGVPLRDGDIRRFQRNVVNRGSGPTIAPR